MVKLMSSLMIGGSLLATTSIWVIKQNQLMETYEDRFYPGTIINGWSAGGSTLEEVEAYLSKQWQEQAQKKVTLKGEDFKEVKTLEMLGLTLEMDKEDLIKIQKSQTERSWLAKVIALNTQTWESHEVTWAIDETKIKQWMTAIVKELQQPAKETNLTLEWKNEAWTPVIQKGQTGIKVDETALWEEWKELPSLPWSDHQSITIPTVVTDFKDQTALLKQVTAPIGTWKSYFNAEESRAKNVKRAATLIHNSVVYPGETFSYNKHVLPATAENGYGYGIIFVNGEKVPGMAGGICQVSSTLYNAVLEAGIKADERTNHSLQVEYVPYGQDATMNDSGLDFKFTNPYDVPILVQATTNGGTLTISLWSDPAVLKGLDYRAYTIAQNTKTYDTYLQVYNAKGELVSSDFLHRSIYR